MTNEELVEVYQKGDQKIFEQIVQQNKGMLCYLKNRWSWLVENWVLSFSELYNECLYGLWLAVKNYKSGECNFSAFAFCCIKRHLRKINHTSKYGKNKINNLKIQTSLDAIVPGTDDFTLGETISDDSALAEFDKIIEISQTDIISMLNSVLTPQEKDIIIRLFGIGCKIKKPAELAHKHKCSQQNIGRIKSEAIQKLRNSSLMPELRSDRKMCLDKIEKIKHQQNADAEQSLNDVLNYFNL